MPETILHDLCKGFGALLSRAKVRATRDYLRQQGVYLLFCKTSTVLSIAVAVRRTSEMIFPPFRLDSCTLTNSSILSLLGPFLSRRSVSVK